LFLAFGLSKSCFPRLVSQGLFPKACFPSVVCHVGGPA
jgi:predicted DNA-binding transcriptional regulator AlpA